MRVALIGPREEPFGDDPEREHREAALRTYQEICGQIPVFGSDYTASREFLGIECLSAVLRAAGHVVRVLSCANEGLGNREVLEEMARFQPQVVGLSVLYDLQLYSALSLTRDLKRSMPDVHVVWGGPLASVIPGVLMSTFRSIDSVVEGEGEVALPALLEALSGQREMASVPALHFRSHGIVRKTPPAPPIDLDSVPAPSRDVIASMRERGLPILSAYLTTSRGCRAFCTFCTIPDLVRGQGAGVYRYRSPSRVVDEMQAVVEEHGVRRFYMADDNFLGYGPESRERLTALADEILARRLDVRFHAECRVDSLERDVLVRLRQAGFDQILFGLESGSDRTLHRWGKGQTVAQNAAAIELARELRFDLVPSLILLDWESTLEEVEETIGFIERTRIYETTQPLSLVNKLKVHCGTSAGRRYEKVHGAPELPAVTDDASLRRWVELRTYQRTPIDDPVVAAFWRALNLESNRWGALVEEIVPPLLGDLRIAVRGDASGEHRAFMSAIRGWRRGLGKMLAGLMRRLIDRARELARTGARPAGLDELARAVVEAEERRFFPGGLSAALRERREKLDAASLRVSGDARCG